MFAAVLSQLFQCRDNNRSGFILRFSQEVWVYPELLSEPPQQCPNNLNALNSRQKSPVCYFLEVRYTKQPEQALTADPLIFFSIALFFVYVYIELLMVWKSSLQFISVTASP